MRSASDPLPAKSPGRDERTNMVDRRAMFNHLTRLSGLAGLGFMEQVIYGFLGSA
ncbi:hypothetical Protein YC6258_05527 [Gynuella sunshinyii YC6258]|uniref:Uncharacterized protein n=1 Tax=Gynuella sunshinyii YC6258 TaxID=1445510 RepID=A0A0C5VE11_9GAMM|nr:hypothetical Protein YC6258_05527 [Gynuella sunshinyii YC6258]